MHDDQLPSAWSSLTSDPTLLPDLTIRPAPSAEEAGPPQGVSGLPSISVDLREARGGEASPGGGRSDLEVRGVIGEGGMGRVLLARQHSLARDVAVKTAKPQAGQAARDAILAEGALTGSLEHPAIVPVHALGLDASGWPAMVMKRVEGVAWDTLILHPTHPGWEGWEGSPADRLPGHLQILQAVCNAIHFAHSRGVVHRDIKPQNVLIGRYGDVYLADWGVGVRVGGGQGQVCGTPAFMAPEMVDGQPVDARTDVYLLGATLHLLLTGSPRHPGATVAESLLHARSSPSFSYAKEIPEELAALANQACHLDPAARHPTAKAFREELSAYSRHREARALGTLAIKRVGEFEALQALEAPTEAEQKQRERLLLEAQFGLEQALALWPDNAPAREALGRLEAIQARRRQRTLELEREARERDPSAGAARRTVGLAGVTVVSGGAASLAFFIDYSAPTNAQLVFFPAVVGGLIGLGGWVMRERLLHTRYNRHIFAYLMLGMLMMVVGRAGSYLTSLPAHFHFVRDSFVIAAFMTACAVSYLRYTGYLAVLFVVAGAACQLWPEQAVRIFSVVSALAFLFATLVSFKMQRALPRQEPAGRRG